ncbi:DUF3667 domain-containing protein [Lutibacter sp. TH_r2]|uniref:DUF3667 domain-containing protein n=1 Tax=Lutibacter sp. TH_r2 TaxID=3082083 RepID=UPI002953C451|nr:DUF3667 domain-containing protein [Lutibacter sp. TH_r2]MDV7186898.1 DUF3667 domain-containing protein [Lutibacter sp. TH_r2]
MKLPLIKTLKKVKNTKGLECLNCGQPLTGNENFCSYCGQKNTTKKLSFFVFLDNLFSGFLSYDSRFWKTFIPLLTKPGIVSKLYIEGKRVRFVNPFQLYLNVSIVFFLLLGITNKVETTREIDKLNDLIIEQNLDSIKNQAIDSILTNVEQEIKVKNPKDSVSINELAQLGSVFKLIKTDSEKKSVPYQYHIKKDTSKQITLSNRIEDFRNFHKKNPTYSNTQALDSLGYKKTFWNKFYYQQNVNTVRNIQQIENDNGKSFIKKLTSYISVSLFVFLPVFTMFLMLLYIRRKYTYMEHLVFVFHTQTVFFLLFIIYYILDLFFKMENTAWVFTVIFLIYLYKAMRNFYKQSRRKTILKFIFLNSYYMFLGVIGFIIVTIASFLAS